MMLGQGTEPFVTAVEEYKRCKDCEETKPLTEFYVNKKSGPIACCKPCMKVRSEKWRKAHPEKSRARCRKYAAQHRDKNRANVDKWRYGVGPTFRYELWAKQDGRCAICPTRITAEAGHIDHDHTTSKVRGMLCRHCNRGLGAFRDSPENLMQAIVYLQAGADPS